MVGLAAHFDVGERVWAKIRGMILRQWKGNVEREICDAGEHDVHGGRVGRRMYGDRGVHVGMERLA